MSTLVDRTITALRTEHDTLVALLANLDDSKLTAPSGADDWTIAQVLSHLGSGAEIGRTPIVLATGDAAETEDNQTIWARWNATDPAGQAKGFIEYDARWLDTVEALTAEQRSSLRVNLGFLPEPVPLLTALGMRLNEVANHSWDVRVALDPQAEIAADSATTLVELLAGPVGFMVGFIGKPAELDKSASIAGPGAVLVIDGAVSVVDQVESPSATFRGAPGAFVRLITGRLKPAHTEDVTVEGNVTLDELRRVFQGF